MLLILGEYNKQVSVKCVTRELWKNSKEVQRKGKHEQFKYEGNYVLIPYIVLMFNVFYSYLLLFTFLLVVIKLQYSILILVEDKIVLITDLFLAN